MYIFNRLLIDVIEIILVYTKSYDACVTLIQDNDLEKKLREVNRKNRIIEKISVVKRISSKEMIYNPSELSLEQYLDSKDKGFDYINVEDTYLYAWGYFNNSRFILYRLHNKPPIIGCSYYDYSIHRPSDLPYRISISNRSYNLYNDCSNPDEIMSENSNYFHMTWSSNKRYSLPCSLNTNGNRLFTRYNHGIQTEKTTIFKYL